MYLSNTYAARLLSRRGAGTVAVAAVAAAVALAATHGAAPASAHTTSPSPVATAASSGTVDVIAAGSLDTVLSKSIDTAFHNATGYTVSLITGSSGNDATAIKNGIDVEDVFLSASPADDAALAGSKNGSWVKWYAAFATSPEVLGYYPKSKFVHDLKTEPWYEVITKSGFLVERTIPSQDPGGVLAREAMLKAAKQHPKYATALKKLANESSDENPNEDAEEASIQDGSADGAFMYEADANSQDSPFVKLTGTNYAGDYTVTMLKNAPHTDAAEAFIKFLLGSKGKALLKKDHFNSVTPPKVSGSGVPAALKSILK